MRESHVECVRVGMSEERTYLRSVYEWRLTNYSPS